MTTATRRAGIKPMLCKVAKAIPEPARDWTMEPKLDGWRFVFDIDEQREVTAYTRRELRLGNPAIYVMPQVTGALRALFPADTALDSEVIVVGTDKQSTDVATALARNGHLRAVVFDVMRLAGHDIRHLPWHQRRHLLELAISGEPIDPVVLMPSNKPSQRLLDGWLEQGLEGAVLKHRESTYVGKRSARWLKIKPQQSRDLVITGFAAGGGKFSGQVGAVEFEHKGRTGRASGMNDALRQEMTDHPERFIGQVAEFAFHGLTKHGALRHPQFKRLRADK